MKLPGLSTILLAAIAAVLLAGLAVFRGLLFYSHCLRDHCPF